MAEKKGYKNYIFDLYGTLVDIHTDERDAELWERFALYLRMRGAGWGAEELSERYFTGVERLEAELWDANGGEYAPEIDVADIFRAFFTERGLNVSADGVAEAARIFRLLSLRKLRLYTGADSVLRGLRASGRRVFLLSNAQALYTRPELTALGLEGRFDGVVLSSEIGKKKPDPAFFEAIMSRFGIAPEETVMVGNDDVADCHGAAGAGLDSMYVHTEQSGMMSGPLPERCRHLMTIVDVLQTI